MKSYWVCSGSDSVQHFIGNLDDWSLLPDLVSPVNLHKAQSVLLSRLLTKTLISIGTGTDPSGTSLVTSCQLDFVPLIKTLWAQQSSQVSTHYILYLSKLCLTNLALRILPEAISKPFVKAKRTTLITLQKPTTIISSSQKTIRLVRHSKSMLTVSQTSSCSLRAWTQLPEEFAPQTSQKRRLSPFQGWIFESSEAPSSHYEHSKMEGSHCNNFVQLIPHPEIHPFSDMDWCIFNLLKWFLTLLLLWMNHQSLGSGTWESWRKSCW